MALSAATSAAIAALFTPLAASAAPPGVLAAPDQSPAAIPDTGSRPVPLGSLVLPGQTTPSTVTTVAAGVATTPLLAKMEKRRQEVALLGDRLLKLREELDIAREQVAAAATKQQAARQAVTLAEETTHTAATAALKDAAALPPGTIGSNLHGLESLSRIQRGEPAGEQAAGRQLTLARAAEQAAATEASDALMHATDLSQQNDRLEAEHTKEQAGLAKLEAKNAAELAADEAAEAARDRELGAGYTGGDSAEGKAADPRAIAALNYALAQRGDPYVWAAEGPNSFDCSGLMWAAYRTSKAGSYQLPRVSKDQYYATRGKAVDRYSLLPGDMLFFSSSNSWTGIHHVAMYAGNGMMVEAPRTGLDVRLVPVRWTRLFQATRVYGPVDGPATPPPVLAPDPTPTKTPTPIPTKSTKPTKPPTKPTPSPSTSSPTPSPSTPKPTAPSPTPSPSTSTSPAGTPSTSASSSSADASGNSSPDTASSATKSSSATTSSSATKTSSATASASSKPKGR